MQKEKFRALQRWRLSYFGRNSENFYFDKIDELYVISLFQAMLEKQEINGGKFRENIIQKQQCRIIVDANQSNLSESSEKGCVIDTSKLSFGHNFNL